VPPFKLVIFDCDGVLVDSERITNQIFIDMLADIGINITLQEVMDNYVGIPLLDGLAILAKKHKINLPEGFVDRFNSKSLFAFENELQAIPGIMYVLAQIQTPFCVASNSHPEKVRTMLKITRLFDSFEGKIFTASLVKKPKPAPDVYIYASQAFNIDPSDCLVIEDSFVGVSAAKAAGMTVYGYSTHSSAKRLLDAGAHTVFDDMKDLPLLIHQYGILPYGTQI